MSDIKMLKDDIPYAKLYNKLKEFTKNKKARAFSTGGLATAAFVTGGLELKDVGFSYDFYEPDNTAKYAENLLNTQTDKAKARLDYVETPSDKNENATTFDWIGELFGEFENQSESVPIPDSYEPELREDELSLDEMNRNELNAPFVAQKQGWMDKTLNLLFEKEGFESTAYKDYSKDSKGNKVFVGWRIGYGSDTITKANGTVVKVKEGMTVTDEDALRDFNRRIKEDFLPQVYHGIGQQTWSKLNANQKAVMVSLAWNYGKVPKRIREAIKTLNSKTGADAIRNLQGDNSGINRNRRLSEADLFEGIVDSSSNTRSSLMARSIL